MNNKTLYVYVTFPIITRNYDKTTFCPSIKLFLQGRLASNDNIYLYHMGGYFNYMCNKGASITNILLQSNLINMCKVVYCTCAHFNRIKLVYAR